jgi:hypothetical protein
MMDKDKDKLMGLRVTFKSNGLLYIPNVKKFNVTDGFLWVECAGNNKGLMALYNVDEIFNVVVFEDSETLLAEMEREEEIVCAKEKERATNTTKVFKRGSV